MLSLIPSKNLINKLSEVKHTFDIYATSEYVCSKIDQFEFKINNKICDYLRIQKFTEFVQDHNSELSNIQDSISGILTENERRREELDHIQQELSKKIENYHLASESTRLWNRIKLMASKEEINEVKQKVGPLVVEVRKKINQFALDCLQSKEIIRRFDEILLDKGSKVAIDQLELRLNTLENNSHTE